MQQRAQQEGKKKKDLQRSLEGLSWPPRWDSALTHIHNAVPAFIDVLEQRFSYAVHAGLQTFYTRSSLVDLGLSIGVKLSR